MSLTCCRAGGGAPAAGPTAPPWMSVTAGGVAAARAADDDRRADARRVALLDRRVAAAADVSRPLVERAVAATTVGAESAGLSAMDRTVTAEGDGGGGGFEATVVTDHAGVGGEPTALPLEEDTNDGREGEDEPGPSRDSHRAMAAAGEMPPPPPTAAGGTRDVAMAMPASVMGRWVGATISPRRGLALNRGTRHTGRHTASTRECRRRVPSGFHGRMRKAPSAPPCPQ